MLAENSKLGLKIYNRGISGNKVPDLDARWDKDALDLKPSILSVLIGVNDIWHKLNGKLRRHARGIPGRIYCPVEANERCISRMLQLVSLRTVCAPLRSRETKIGFPNSRSAGPSQKKSPTNAGATWVPFQKMFDAAVAAGTEPAYWAADGVHPTQAGHALMAKTWRETVGV